MNIKEKILNKIKVEDIKPTGHWQFVLKQIFVWMGVILLVVIASIVTSAIIFNITSTDWMLRPRLGWGIGRFFFVSLPYFWIILFIAFGAAAYYVFKNTKHGYKYAFPIVLTILFLVSVSFGVAWHKGFKSGEFIERRAMMHIPHYPDVMPGRRAIMFNPEKGILAGKITRTIAESKFELSDFDKQIWTVFCDDCRMPPIIKLDEDELVSITGEREAEFLFIAEEIRPMFGFRTMEAKN
ncbi:MAG: hypothetical protein WC323_01225 [Patescibacteria group bacterium]|jgi:tryptophan-rich sensory protein